MARAKKETSKKVVENAKKVVDSYFDVILNLLLQKNP